MGNDDLDLPERIGETLARMAIAAGKPILDVYAGAMSVETKADCSPVTLADQRAEIAITADLGAHFPHIPVVAEEAVSQGAIPAHGGTLFLVDPLDGTREFIARRGEFTVNIALIIDHRPVAGVVYAPALHNDRGWICFADMHDGAFEADIADPGHTDASLPDSRHWRPLSVRTPPRDGLTAIASRSHRDATTDAFLSGLNIAAQTSAGSALKFCVLARGDADVYPRFAPTMEWDSAAGHAVLNAAGGCVVGRDGAPLRYGLNPGAYKNPSFIAWGQASPPEK